MLFNCWQYKYEVKHAVVVDKKKYRLRSSTLTGGRAGLSTSTSGGGGIIPAGSRAGPLPSSMAAITAKTDDGSPLLARQPVERQATQAGPKISQRNQAISEKTVTGLSTHLFQRSSATAITY